MNAPQAKAVGVIPARWASTRFPGKILAPLCGKPLVQWVVERAAQARLLEAVIVATDDARIQDAVAGWGGTVKMTRADHPSGTDRVAEAAAGRDEDIVVNIQGDEPMIDPALLDQLIEALVAEPEWDMATAAAPIHSPDELNAPSVVKVVTDGHGRALYFSRSVIPHVRDKEAGGSAGAPLHWRHIGVYAYRTTYLQKLVKTPPCALEEAEKLEQLRALHLGCRMKVIPTGEVGMGVDTPEDLAKAEELMKEAGWA